MGFVVTTSVVWAAQPATKVATTMPYHAATMLKRELLSKLRVYRDDHWWLAKNRNDWRDEIRISPKQADRAIKILVSAGLVVTRNSLFDGKRTPHLRINWDAFHDAWRNNLPAVEPDTQLSERNIGTDQRETPVLTKGEHRSSPKGNTGVDRRATPITETTAKPTAETTAAAASSVTCSIHDAEMQLRIKNGDRWYSHRLPDGNWCRGHPGDAPGNDDNKSKFVTCHHCGCPVYAVGTCEHGCWHCCTECWETGEETSNV